MSSLRRSMQVHASVFKAHDIRGVVGRTQAEAALRCIEADFMQALRAVKPDARLAKAGH